MCICRSSSLFRGTFSLDDAGDRCLVPCGVPAHAHQRSSCADYCRTIFRAVLAIIAIVLKTNCDAYENDQFSRSERS